LLRQLHAAPPDGAVAEEIALNPETGEAELALFAIPAL